MKKIMSIFIGTIFTASILSGCISQEKEIQETETPTPEETPTPTEPPKPDLSGQITEIEDYGTELGLSQNILQILNPAYSSEELSDEQIETIKSVMSYISQIPEKYGKFSMFRETAANMVMEDYFKKITNDDKKSVLEYKNLVNRNITQMKELKEENFTLEDKEQVDVEKNYLENPTDSNARKLKEYYLEEIKKIYPELARELEKLPELSKTKISRDALEAIEDIYGLLLTAKPYENYDDRFDSTKITKANETWEAFELMINGGTPDQNDFGYDVPSNNTELQALLWILQQNEAKKNDTLLQAIAMDNGLYITMGDKQVRAAVYKDMNDLLKFFRETNMWQLENGFYLLEDYPLEAKVALGWTGNESMRHGYGPPIGLIYYKNEKLPIDIYRVNNVKIDTLKKMRQEAEKLKLIDEEFNDVNNIVGYLEDYLFFSTGKNFNYRTDYDNIVNNEGILAVHDVDWQFKNYKKGLKFQGDCGTEMVIMDAWLKSLGIATLTEWTYTKFIEQKMKKFSHSFIIYYDPSPSLWKTYHKQFTVVFEQNLKYMNSSEDQKFDLFICKLPVNQIGYLNEETFKTRIIDGKTCQYTHWKGNMYYLFELIPYKDIKTMFLQGIPTIQMKKWLLYS